MNKRKILSLLFLILIMPLMSSCYDYSEIEREILIFTLGVDKTKTGYEVSAETIDASDYGGQLSVKPEIITSTGNSIFDAISKLDGKFNNKVNLSHCELIIIGEDYAKSDGINDILNLVFEKNNLRFNTILTTTYKSSAKDILNSKSHTETFHGFEIIEQLSKNKLFTNNSRAYRVINTIENKGKEAILPVIKNTEEGEKKNFYANKIAVLKKDKLIGYIEEKDVNFYSFLMNEKNSIQLNLKKNNNTINTKITLNNTKEKIENNTLNINMDVNAYIESIENKNITEKEIENEIKKNITKELISLIDVVQKKFKVDIFGYGYRLNNFKEKSSVEDWNKYFETLKKNVYVNVNLKEDMEE